SIINDIPAPTVEVDKPFQMLVTSLAHDSFLGKYAIGRVGRGVVKKGQQVALIKRDGTAETVKVDKLFGYRGLNREEVDVAGAGDIVAITGITNAHIGETLADKDQPEALPVIEIEAPTISMYLGPNTSPLKGKEAKYNTSRQIGDRLKQELETNVSLRVAEEGIGFVVSGRGELHLSVLIETLRREDFEFEVGRPQDRKSTRLNSS